MFFFMQQPGINSQTWLQTVTNHVAESVAAIVQGIFIESSEKTSFVTPVIENNNTIKSVLIRDRDTVVTFLFSL